VKNIRQRPTAVAARNTHTLKIHEC